MTSEKLLNEKRKLADINQELSLIKRNNPAFSQLTGSNSHERFLKERKKKIQQMESIIGEMEALRENIKKLQDSANQYSATYIQSSFEKMKKEIDIKTKLLETTQLEIEAIEKKTRLCEGPAYVRFCSLMAARDHIENSIKNEESRQSLLTTFCYDAKQRRLLPLNIKEEIAHHLGTEWGTNLMKKYADLSVSYLPDKVQVVNANNEPEISTDEKGGLCMYKRPSQNEKLADLMVEMYFKAIEDRIGKVHIHQASGPDADFMAKKIALGLQQRGYLDNRVNGQLVTDILGIKKEIEQPASAPVDAATATPPSPSAATTDHHKALNPLQEEEKRTSPTTSISNQSEPELPDWYIKQLEADKLAENDSSPSLKMR